MCQVSFEEVARILQDCFKGIEKEVSEVFQGSFNVLWGMFKQCVRAFQSPIQKVSMNF